MQKLFSVVFIFLLTATSLLAEGTHTWQQSSYDELEQGTARGVAIRSQGGLELAPAFAPLFTTPSTYIWAIADDGQGTVYAAAGSPARVYRITPQGEATVVFQPSELQVQALVVGRDGAIYAGTSPDGKVYKIERTSPTPAAGAPPTRTSRNQQQLLPRAPQNASPGDASPGSSPDAQDQNHAVPVDPNYKATVLFEPDTKYIWDLALDSQGQLYVATGDRGEIFRVPGNGQPASLFFKSDEAHIRVLAFDPNGNLIAGSDGSGLVYRISPSGEGFVLYSASKKEITALALDGSGNIYAAAVGEKRAGTPGGTPMQQSMPATSTTITVTAGGGGGMTTSQSIPQVAPPPVLPMQVVTGGSDVYRIAPDGSPKQLWSSKTDVVYGLAFDQDRLIIGTGNTGRIYAVHNNGDSTDLVKASANHVSALTRAASGGLYAATSNLGKLFRLRAVPDAEGTYESDVFDAKIFSRWGRADVRGAGHFDLYARSGNVDNPDRNWSSWQKVDFGTNEGKLNIPPARFVQWKAVLFAGTPAPVVNSVTLNYLPKNVAPEISDIAVQPGARFQPTTRPATETVTINVGQQNNGNNSANQRSFQSNAAAIRDRGYIAVRWAASDENDDSLVYSLYYRGEKESRWKLLAENLDESQHSFEAALLPDGGYVMMVIASDAVSHSPEEALTTSKISNHFEVDTTPPQVQNLNAVLDGNSVRAGFRAVDGFSPLQRAEYSIDAGPWQYLEPVGALSDFRVQEYSFSAPIPAASAAQRPSPSNTAPAGAQDVQEHVVVVRVYDRFDNMSSAKVTVRK